MWTGDPPACIPYPSPISPDGRFLAYEAETRFDRGGGGPTGVVVRDLATGRVLWRTDEKVYAYSMEFAPDGELLALGRHEGAVSVYEVRTGKPVWEFKHADRVTGLAFAPDGMTLAAASPDAPVFLWDVYGTRTRAGPAPTPAAVDRAAAELGAADPAAAFRAVRTLHAAPAEAVRAIRAAVKPVAAPDPATVRQLIAELDSPDFATRERAERELTRRVALVGDAVAEALRTETEPEPRARLMRVMSAAGRPQPDDLRGVRAVGVLARVGAAEAAAVLRELAGGAKGSPVTRAAAAALERAPK